MEVRDLKVGEVARLGRITRLSIYSLILIWARLHDRWGGHMGDYMDRRLPHLPGVPHLDVNRPLEKHIYKNESCIVPE